MTNPTEIDTRIAQLELELVKQYAEIDRQLNMARREASERPMRSAKKTIWRSTNEQARERLVLRAKSADPQTSWSIYNAQTILENLETAERATIDINGEIARLQAEYDRQPWSRFFLVKPNGHIHSSRSCSTCFTTTSFYWLPNFSGKNEREAVAEHGPLLCSVCFPTAPTEWTRGVQKVHCSGSQPKTGTVRTWARGRFGDCPCCGRTVDIKTNGELKKHKPAAKTS
jgi:uncharacterized small protein (DUF1192 family)